MKYIKKKLSRTENSMKYGTFIGSFSKSSEKCRRELEEKVKDRILGLREVVRIIINLGGFLGYSSPEIANKVRGDIFKDGLTCLEYGVKTSSDKLDIVRVYKGSKVYAYLEKLDDKGQLYLDGRNLEDLLKDGFHKKTLPE